jgi:phosphoglycolate phosphatase-like HAD superfamily hydrolase
MLAGRATGRDGAVVTALWLTPVVIWLGSTAISQQIGPLLLGAALVEAVRRATGLETTVDGIPVQGMLDRDILAAMMSNSGATAAAVRRAMPQIFEHAQAIYADTCPSLARKVCPGVRTTLARLHRVGVLLGLVTGNLSEIGWIKMRHAGLDRYFQFGAFAEMGRTRSDLVRLAVRRARGEGWIRRDSPVSLVGDHPNDVLAAKLNDIRSIAVATGVVGAAELAKHDPDYLLPDLRSLGIDMVL